MTPGERQLLRYARDILNGPADAVVSENIAKLYLNLLLRSRAHEIGEVNENIDCLEEIGRQPDLSLEAQRLSGEGRIIAFSTLLTYDQSEAMSLVNRAEQNQILLILGHALRHIPGAQVTLYNLWKDVAARLSEDTLQSAITEWIGMAANYCRAMLPANPLAAFYIWMQACEWSQRFPSPESRVSLIERASSLMMPNDRSLYRMNHTLWVFVQEQNESRALPDELGREARIWSLLVSLKRIEAEIAEPEANESIREIWATATSWMTEDMILHAMWPTVESAVHELAARPLDAIKPIEAQLNLVWRNWKEKYGVEVTQDIQLSRAPAAWVDRPLYSDDWTEVTDEAEIRKLLWPLAPPGRILSGKSSMIERVRFLTPSFYPDQVLVEVQVPLEDGVHAICSALIDDSHQATTLTGQSPAIHNLNARGFLKRLDERDVALDYLRFFCAAVWGEAGPFRVVETLEDIPFSDSADEESFENVRRFLLEQPREATRLPDGNWEARVLVCYRDALFRAQFKIVLNGMVEMISDEPLAQDLPVRRIVMRDGFRLYDGVWEKNVTET